MESDSPPIVQSEVQLWATGGERCARRLFRKLATTGKGRSVKAEGMTENDATLVPRMGWAALSRSRLNRAEAQLVKDAQGVRDEVGVLALHTGYANRFFPGTSTQQTRLRYALFVPWRDPGSVAQKEIGSPSP